MTTLGLIFVGIFLLAFAARGRPGLLLALAVSVPFNDSIVVSSGALTLTPFYAGALLYLGVAYAGRLGQRSTPPGGRTLLTSWWLYVAAVTLVGPTLFAGVGVFAPGLGLDAQVGALTAYAFSSSLIAQLAYLGINLVLLDHNESTRDLSEGFIRVAMTVGTLVASAAVVVGDSFPHELFDNSPRNFYAEGLSDRVRGQFSEPSHLGAFALAALAFFLVSVVTGPTARVRRWSVLYAVLAFQLMVLSVSGTAVLGALVALMVLAIIIAPKLVNGQTKIPPGAVITGSVVLIGVVLASPTIYDFVNNIIQGKQDTQSLITRSATNRTGFELLEHSYGLGIGLGGNRASSLAAQLLSTIGVIGTLLFVVVLVRALRRSLPDRTRVASGVALVAIASASFVSIADFASPVLWALIAVCWPVASTGEPEIVEQPVERRVKRRRKF